MQGLTPVQVVALVGVLGVGAQWLAWRLRLPAIVLMLGVGLLVGPVMGWFLPERDLGPIYRPLISVAVAIILFEGGLTLTHHHLGDARGPVQRLVYLGAPLGWALSAGVLWLAVGLSWQASAVFGGVMVVTGPTVIAPMLRQAKLRARPARILQWEAILNDPIGVLIAVKEAYLHCAKAVNRAKLWDAAMHINRAELPSYMDMLGEQVEGLTREENLRQDAEMARRGMY